MIAIIGRDSLQIGARDADIDVIAGDLAAADELKQRF